jgi:hypothetical protein
LAYESGDRYVLGNPFFENYYVVFDIESSVVGVGLKKGTAISHEILPDPN